MRNLVLIALVILFSITILAQDPSNSLIKEKVSGEELAEFEKASSRASAEEKISALKDFIEKYPESSQKTKALELIVSARAELADQKLRLEENEEGIRLFKLAVEETPEPISDQVFTGLLSKFPINLYFRGQREAAYEVANMIEAKIGENARQLLDMSGFYLSVEDASQAIRIAEKVLEIAPESAAAYQTKGLAHRINFELEEAAAAYAKAAELRPDSIVAKSNLAEMKRALGLPEEAVSLYKEILETNETYTPAQTGLALALFDAAGRAEAEAQMTKILEENPKNLPLLAGAAYWYAAHDLPEEAVKYGNQAVNVEPRYTWTYIALARAYTQQGMPDAAERVLLSARKYGDFPTLEYELASARVASGFFKEAAEDLRKSFKVENGLVKTKLGGRVETEGESFIDVLSLERRASILQIKAADDEKNAELIKNLLNFTEEMGSETTDPDALVYAANSFIEGEDNMKTHRQLFVANQLLENKKALSEVLEITKASVKGVDSALNVIAPSAAVLADELYVGRKLALTRDQTVVVPDIPRSTLSRIIRGRIEEISGWALFNEGKTDEAIVRLKTAISILPFGSAWSRSSNWRLGTILESQGKSEEALEAYIKGYSEEQENTAKKLVIENIYSKIHGSLEGLDEKLKEKPAESDITNIFSARPIENEEDENKTESEENEAPPKENSAASKEAISEVNRAQNKLDIRKIPKVVPIARPTPNAANVSNQKSSSPPSESETKQDETEKFPSEALPENIDLDRSKLSISESISKKPASETILKGAGNISSIPEDETPKENAADEPAKKPEIAENEPQRNEADKPSVNKGEESIRSRFGRPRIVSEESIAVKKDPAPGNQTCEIILSQDEISILNGGGGLGILVGIEEGKDDPQTIRGKSSSPEDIQVVYEPEIGVFSGRAFFLIKSISGNTGEFTVTFTTPCGKKEVSVNVR